MTDEIQELDATYIAGRNNDRERQPSLLSEVSREMVKLYKEQFGRGPTRVRSNWCGEDTLVCTLEETLTPAEQNLRQLGEHQRLRDMRMFFQYAAVAEFIAPIERLTHRRVRSFVSGMDTEEDVAVELFVLHPRGSDAPSRARKASSQNPL